MSADPAAADAAAERPAVEEALAAAVAVLGGDERAGQVAMAEAVAGTLAGGPHLLVQAGTGTGKSLAYLVPAVLHAADADNAAVVVATATLALQRQLIEKDLPVVTAALAPLLDREPSFAVLKGRRNYVCLDRLRRGAGEDDTGELFDIAETGRLGRQAKALRAWAEATDTGDRDDYPRPVDPIVWRSMSVSAAECLGRQRCAFGGECFAELARERARAADVVVANHALLAIDVMEGVPVLPEHDAVIVDEAHELVDRATSAVTAELSVRSVERAAARVRRLLDADVVDRLEEAGERLGEAMAGVAGAGRGPIRLDPVGRDLLLALTGVRDAGHAALAALAADRADAADPESAGIRQRARAALSDVHDVAGRLIAPVQGDVAWLDPGEGRRAVLRVAPLSVSGLLREALFATRTVVLTSATLAVGGTFEPVAAAVGLVTSTPDRPDTRPARPWQGLDVGSPFDHAAQGILYVARRLPPPGREGSPDAAFAELADLVDAAGGRTLALFSSWRGVERAEVALRERFAGRPDRPLLVQRRGDAVADLVRRFAAAPRTTLLGTLSLWQGVDVPGPACTCVVIDRIPFPRPDDPLLAARQKAVDDAGGSGFRAISVPRAGLLLAQGVGRLIRGGDDRGVVAVLDPRLATAGYGPALRASLPPFWFTTDGAVVRGALRRLDAALTAAEALDPGAAASAEVAAPAT